jgi:hypothetical protein
MQGKKDLVENKTRRETFVGGHALTKRASADYISFSVSVTSASAPPQRTRPELTRGHRPSHTVGIHHALLDGDGNLCLLRTPEGRPQGQKCPEGEEPSCAEKEPSHATRNIVAHVHRVDITQPPQPRKRPVHRHPPPLSPYRLFQLIPPTWGPRLCHSRT